MAISLLGHGLVKIPKLAEYNDSMMKSMENLYFHLALFP
ncbi:hypothetical protein SAMN05421796_102335 [Chryseobacterium piscicola]|uniref:Uncharacterized protein n=2 Tax=Chryseobacterium group TaxID=2782232 RepID=A0A1N7LHV9_9FLAO|nr:hypothetical protein SAMN05421796_102335 [Chryseobacterium piscicola]